MRAAYNIPDARVVCVIGFQTYLPRRTPLASARGSRRRTLRDDGVDAHRVEWKERSAIVGLLDHVGVPECVHVAVRRFDFAVDTAGQRAKPNRPGALSSAR
jgi:hypothetical protein